MATLKQLEEGIRRAHAAGNAEHVKKLGAEYRRLQASGDEPKVNMSVTDAFARKTKVPPPAPERPNLLNSTAATVNGLVAAVPGLQTASDAILGAGGMLLGKDYVETVQGLQEGRERIAEAAPIARMAGEIAPVMVGAAAAPKIAGMVGSTTQRVVNSAASMAGYEGLKSVGEGNDSGDVLTDMGVGAAGGAAGAIASKVVEKVGSGIAKAVTSRAQNAATSKAVANAPAAEDLASAASQLFKSSKASGVGVKPNVFGTFAQKTAAAAKAADIDRELDQGAWAVYERMIEYARDGFVDPASLSLSRLHNLRQLAQDVALEAKKNRTKVFAQQLIDGLDDMIAGLKPADLFIPPGRLGAGGAINPGLALLEGISTWSKAKKVGIIEQAIAKAQNYSSGVESGLVNQFRALLNNKNTAKLFTKQEREALQAVVQGTAPVKALRALGIFKGLGGAAVGSSFGPWGAAAGWVAGAGGKKITEAATMKAAQRAGMVAATPNIPTVPMAPNVLLPARQPIDLLIRGGAVTSDR
jgi:hypothetical protein